jgi:hypothetical protein
LWLMPKVLKRVTKRASKQLTPAISPAEIRAALKIKRRPRGKSFEKGNGFGAEHRYKPGQTGNPGGRTKCSEIRKYLRIKLGAEVALPRKGRTYAERVVDKWIDLALAGNAAAISAIADNAEGRPAVTILGDGRPDVLVELRDAMNRRSSQIGPPEGFDLILAAKQLERLEEGDDSGTEDTE